MSTAPRRVAHLDMDAFYASVELLRYPQLRGRPVVVGGRRAGGQGDAPSPDPPGRRLGDYRGRGVVTTASYEARTHGVHSAMPLMRAARLCPEAVLLPADFDAYRHYSQQFKQVITEHAGCIEDRGIDEVYIDFSQAPGGQEQGGRTLAARIQEAIRARTGLTCSIGVAPNKLLAKMASELRKPNGISIVHEADLATRIWPLPCRKIHGIGPKAGARLEQLGVRTIGELARCEVPWLTGHFGRHLGAWMHEAAWGWDDRPVVTHSEPVSMSRETTFERDLHAVYDRLQLREVFRSLCERLAQDLQRDGYAARTISVKLRYDNFQRLTRDQTLDAPVNDVATIRRIAGQCLRRADLQRRLRLLGLRASGLVRSAVPVASTAPVPPLELPLFPADVRRNR